jgi:hypothetical protein
MSVGYAQIRKEIVSIRTAEQRMRRKWHDGSWDAEAEQVADVGGMLRWDRGATRLLEWSQDAELTNAERDKLLSQCAALRSMLMPYREDAQFCGFADSVAAKLVAFAASLVGERVDIQALLNPPRVRTVNEIITDWPRATQKERDHVEHDLAGKHDRKVREIAGWLALADRARDEADQLRAQIEGLGLSWELTDWDSEVKDLS